MSVFYVEAIPPEQAPEGFPYIYYLRHDENNWTKPISIEPYVFANFFGTVFMKNKLEFDKNRYIDVKRFKFEGDYVVLDYENRRQIKCGMTNKNLNIYFACLCK